MASKVNNPYGEITIEDHVIERIAAQTTMESYGIVGLAARSPKDKVYRLLRIETMTEGVKVFPQENGSIRIQIHVIMDAGVRVSMVGGNVIETVRYNVESRTGLTVESVDVIVQGLRV